MTYQSDVEISRPVESEVDRAQRKEARRGISIWSYVAGVAGVAAIVVLGFIYQDDSPKPAYRASSSNSSN